MKKLVFFLTILTVVVFSSNLFAINFSEQKREIIISNLLEGMNSSNNGLRTSSAYILYNLISKDILSQDDASGALIPLMKMVREGKSEEEKIVAALSLYKLGDSRGIYLLKGASIFDESERIRSLTKNLYCSFHLENGDPVFCNYY